jgi:hypothetical protein
MVVVAPTDEDVLSLATKWVNLLAQAEFEQAQGLLVTSSEGIWTPTLVKAVIAAYELPPRAGDNSPTSRVTPPHAARVVDYRPDRDVTWFPDGSDQNAGMVHYSLPINGIWSDLTAIFRIHRQANGVALDLEDVHVL